MGGIFINYRGEDSQTAATLIDRELTARFGEDLVFLDSRSIQAGSDFVVELLRRVRACSVLLVVIGPCWLTLTNAAGKRQIDDPQDWVRREIAEAFILGLRVVPVLTDGATLPAETELPDDIAGLSRRQYVPLRQRRPGLPRRADHRGRPGVSGGGCCRPRAGRPQQDRRHHHRPGRSSPHH